MGGFYGYRADAPTPVVRPGQFPPAFSWKVKRVSLPNPIEGTTAEDYLLRRGIRLADFSFQLDALHFFQSVFHSMAPNGDKRRFRALGAYIRAYQYGNEIQPIPIGGTFTFLEHDGRKLDRPGLKPRLFAKGGHVVPGGVWFGTPSPTEMFVVGEGIESTLSAMILFGASAGVATLAANFLPAVRFPECVERVRVAADHDGPETHNIGFRKAAYAADVWRKEGYEVALMRPPDPGTDFNDVLRKRRGIAP
jgi:hypothetical protein